MSLEGVPTRELVAELDRRREPDDVGFVGVCCQGPGCQLGGYFPDAIGSLPLDDDGHELIYDECAGGYLCAGCAGQR